MIKSYEQLQNLFFGTNAYLVGGGARNVLRSSITGEDLEQPRDWDVVIDSPTGFDRWVGQPSEWEPNAFGGRKYPSIGVDVWVANIGTFLSRVPRGKDGIARHLETGAWLFTLEFSIANSEPIKTRPVMIRYKGVTNVFKRMPVGYDWERNSFESVS